MVKVLWHDGVGMSLYIKKLERGRFIWPVPKDGAVAISAAQLTYLLDGIDWRNPRHAWRPAVAGYSSPHGRLFSKRRAGHANIRHAR